MTCRAWLQLPLDEDGINSSIDTQILKKRNILVHLVALENGKKTYIGTLNKDRGDIFSECCAEIFKAKFLRYFNEVLFKRLNNP